MTTTLERVRAAVIKAVPEIVYVVCSCKMHVASSEHGYHGSYGCRAFLGGRYVHERDITLADCFAALGIGVSFGKEALRHEQEIVHTLAVMWDPRLPLHLQSEEALTFLDETLNHD